MQARAYISAGRCSKSTRRKLKHPRTMQRRVRRAWTSPTVATKYWLSSVGAVHGNLRTTRSACTVKKAPLNLYLFGSQLFQLCTIPPSCSEEQISRISCYVHLPEYCTFRYPPLSCRGLCLDDTYPQVVNVSMVQTFQQQVHVQHALIRSVVALTCAHLTS